MLARIVIQTRETVDGDRATIKVRHTGFNPLTTETAVVDQPGTEDEKVGGHHRHFTRSTL